jgi:hypothetical protein
MKKISTFLPIKEMQTKMALRFYLTPVRMAINKQQQMLVRMQGKKNPFLWFVEMKISPATMGIHMEVLPKTENRTTV